MHRGGGSPGGGMNRPVGAGGGSPYRPGGAGYPYRTAGGGAPAHNYLPAKLRGPGNGPLTPSSNGFKARAGTLKPFQKSFPGAIGGKSLLGKGGPGTLSGTVRGTVVTLGATKGGTGAGKATLSQVGGKNPAAAKLANTLARLLAGASKGGQMVCGGDMPDCCGGMPAVCYPAGDGTGDGACMVVGMDPDSAAQDAPADSDDDSASQQPDGTARQTSRYLRVANGTNEKLTVYVQVKAEASDDEWVWYPGEPGSDRVLAYELEPGQTADLSDGDWQLNGSRVRLWAESVSHQYLTFRDQDLWLVPETDNEDYHAYYASGIQTLDITIR
jgi:hypothetical protein